MGKYLLLLVGAAAIGGAIQGVGRLGRDANSADGTTRDRQSVTAERHARTALAAAASQVRRDFGAWRSGVRLTQFAGGAFEATVQGSAVGPVRVRATGHSGASRHRVQALLARVATPVDGALLIDADTAVVSIAGTSRVTGRDARSQNQFAGGLPTEGSGHGGNVHAVLTRTQGLGQALAGALPSNGTNAVGRGGSADVSADAIRDLTPMLREAEENATSRFTGDRTFSAPDPSVFGQSYDDPRIVYIDGDATFTGAVKGYGMLLVDGALTARDNFEWHGLVVARGAGGMTVTLGGNARVYGAVYVLHESGYELGPSFYPLRTLWAVDAGGRLRYYPVRDDGIEIASEGLLYGLGEGTVSGGGSAVDVEAIAFAPDGTAYFVNNVDGNGNRLYKILPAQFDGDASTRVVVTPIGQTGRNGANEVAGLVYHQGSLYGISRQNRRLYLMNTSTGAASEVRQFTAAGTSAFITAGLTRGADGAIYTARQVSGTTQLWRFAEFPSGEPTLTATLSGTQQSIAGHPKGLLFAHNGTQVRQARLPGGAVQKTQALAANFEAMTFYGAGEDGGAESMVPPLMTLQRREGFGTHTYSLPWDGGPDLTIRATFPSASLTSEPWAYGTTLTEAAASADLFGATPVGSAVSAAYKGPTPLPLFRFNPGASTAGVRTAQISLELSEAFTSPFSLYLVDADWQPTYFTAYNAAGQVVSTSGWQMTADLDVVGAQNTTAMIFEPAGLWNVSGSGVPSGSARLRRSAACAGGDCEMTLNQIVVNNFSQVRRIVVHASSPGGSSASEDWMYVSLASQPLFSTGADLRVSLEGNAQVVFSAETIGKLVGRLPSLNDVTRVVSYDEYARDLEAASTSHGQLWQARSAEPSSSGSGSGSNSGSSNTGSSGSNSGSDDDDDDDDDD